MIIVVGSSTDQALIDEANRTLAADHDGSFGGRDRVFVAFRDVIPPLNPNEDLIISAHGAANYRGRPAVGDSASAFVINAQELYANIRDIFPMGYAGRVFIDACQSGNEFRDQISFASEFELEVRSDRPDVREVYGRDGKVPVADTIPRPDAVESWKRTELER